MQQRLLRALAVGVIAAAVPVLFAGLVLVGEAIQHHLGLLPSIAIVFGVLTFTVDLLHY